MYRSINPDWYYDYVKIENLEEIVQELRHVYFSQSARMRCSTPYWNIYADQFLECTAFHDFLKSFNLFKKFEKIIFNDLVWSHLPNWKRGEILPHALHIDSFDAHVKFSLNIPIDQCENSYICWYKVDDVLLMTTPIYYSQIMVGDPQEIQRVEMVKPMLINATIPHRGQFINPDRLLACVRFDPELTNEEVKKLTGIDIPIDTQYTKMLTSFIRNKKS